MSKIIVKGNDPALADMIYRAIQTDQLIEASIYKATRTNAQNRARWLYLSMISDILNERGETFNPPNTKMEVPFTKDNLYSNYWQTLRFHMYKDKKKLNTKEFSELTEMAGQLFAKVFSISINFPNWQDYLDKKENDE